jgi:hypothetical protein
MSEPQQDKVQRLLDSYDADIAGWIERICEIRSIEREAAHLRAKAAQIRSLSELAAELEAEGINAAAIRRKLAALASEPERAAAGLPQPQSPIAEANGAEYPPLPPPRPRRGRPPKAVPQGILPISSSASDGQSDGRPSSLETS